MSCRCRKIDCASVRGLTAHGYSLIARKPVVGVGATWRFAGTPPSLGASTHARVSGARVDVMSEGNNQLGVIKKWPIYFGRGLFPLELIVTRVTPFRHSTLRARNQRNNGEDGTEADG